MKYIRALLASALGAGALVEFLFWGSAGVGFTILFLILLAAYYIACGFPKAGVRHTAEHIALAVIIVALALCYSLFANESLRILNFLALTFLMGLLFLQGTVGKNLAWDLPVFHAELWAGYFVRPFACITRPWKEFSDLRNKKKADAEHTGSAAKRKIVFQVLAALLAAVPLLFILVSLLAASDPVFRNIFKPITDWFMNLHIEEVAGKIVLFLFLLPFVASTIWSYRDSFSVSASAGLKTTIKTPLIPPASAITILAMVNAVYLLYAGVQFAYLFGAWGGNLPDGLTPAEYARSGFFELAFISSINIILLLCSIRLTRREGRSGLVIRCLSTCLLVLSSVQLVSAMLRMRLYIQAFGFTQLRYFVTAFMILMAAYFVFLLLREFVSGFPLLRCMLFAGAAALVILNYSVPDAQIAQYNISHYESGELKTLDTEYIINSLSADAYIVLLENENALVQYDSAMKRMYAEMRQQLDPTYPEYSGRSWKLYNMNEERVAQYF